MSATIVLDAMGSDHGPAATVAGAVDATRHPKGPRVVLVGDEATLRRELDLHPHDASRIEIVHAPDAIAMHDDPRAALDARPRASILVGAELVRDGRGQALVSAGNSGAVTLACARVFGRLPGVARAAVGAVFPTERRRGEKDDPFSLILDAGLTLDVNADDLVVFAVMGSAYAARISKNPKPRVALLSNGSEPHKGTTAIVEAHKKLLNHAAVNFIGNIEGIDIPQGAADVIVTGGFTGNIVLKMYEGMAETVMRLARYATKKHLVYRAGMALLYPALRQLREVTDWEQYGGAPLLGFEHVAIKAHGRSSPRAIKNAIRVAQKAIDTDLVAAIRSAL